MQLLPDLLVGMRLIPTGPQIMEGTQHKLSYEEHLAVHHAMMPACTCIAYACWLALLQMPHINES